MRQLTEHDFYGADPQPRDRIRIIATVTDFQPNDPSEHQDWFQDRRAVPKWLDRKGELHPEQDDEKWKLACEIAYCARFDRVSLEVEQIRYFHDDDSLEDPFADEIVSTVPANLIREIGFFLVPANRTWDRIISFASELFRRVIESAQAKPAESVLAERDRLRRPDRPLEEDANLSEIVGNLNGELKGFFRHDPALKLRVTTTDSEGVLDAVVPHYAYGSDALTLPARRQGAGLVSLQGLLLLLEFGRRRAESGDGFFMAVEEPELHVPPPLQRRLVQRLQSLSTQTVISTHSPVVASLTDPKNISILRNDGGTLSSVRLQRRSLPATTPNSVRKLFQLNRMATISALMHDVVLIPEGSTDYEWLDILMRAVDSRQTWTVAGDNRFGTYVGLIGTHDAAVEATFDALMPLHPRIAVLVDGDTDGVRYATSLSTKKPPPSRILRWRDGDTLEDVIGWILSADEPTALGMIGASFAKPSSVTEFVARLKSDDRSAGGLKQDRLAYDEIGAAIAGAEPCSSRARDLLNALSEECQGISSALFADRDSIRVFSA